MFFSCNPELLEEPALDEVIDIKKTWRKLVLVTLNLSKN